MLRKFLAASYRGYEFARSNPDQAADIMVKMFPTLDRAVVLDQIKDINELVVDGETAGKGIGYITRRPNGKHSIVRRQGV